MDRRPLREPHSATISAPNAELHPANKAPSDRQSAAGTVHAQKLFNRLADALESDWRTLARPSQLPPDGAWRIWLLLAGRGFGKTRSGAEWVRSQIEMSSASRVALVAATAADARDVMVEGESGILAISPEWNRPVYEPSKRRLTWPNGAIATCYSADEPDRLRGPQHDAAWCDELAAWRYAEAWDMLMLGLRIGKNPQCVVTTTPKPTRLVRDLLNRKDVAVTRGRTVDNKDHLAPGFLEQILAQYQDTRLGRQELDAELLEDVPGALWTHEMIERSRISGTPDFSRVVVAIDPAATSNEDSDETGIVVAATDGGGRGYVLADLSGRYPPHEWARRAISAYRSYNADRIIAETNHGGEMVEATLRALDPSIPFKAVHASRGKVARAEPVSALYEQRRVHHIGMFADLEDQMTAFAPDFDRSRAGFSPDRVDALVWALTELVLGKSFQGWLDLANHTAENIRAGRPMHSSRPTPQDRVALRAPRPHMLFAPAKGVRYVADEDGIIRDVDPDHVKALHAVGCTDDLSGAPLMDVLRSPAPHHTFMPRTGTTYTSDGNCIIRNVAPEDRGLLLMAGCTAITEDTEEH